MIRGRKPVFCLHAAPLEALGCIAISRNFAFGGTSSNNVINGLPDEVTNLVCRLCSLCEENQGEHTANQEYPKTCLETFGPCHSIPSSSS
jgi:hypothetical protein